MACTRPLRLRPVLSRCEVLDRTYLSSHDMSASRPPRGSLYRLTPWSALVSLRPYPSYPVAGCALTWSGRRWTGNLCGAHSPLAMPLNHSTYAVPVVRLSCSIFASDSSQCAPILSYMHTAILNNFSFVRVRCPRLCFSSRDESANLSGTLVRRSAAWLGNKLATC